MNTDIALVERILTGSLSLPAEFDSSAMARALGMSVESIASGDGEAVVRFSPDPVFVQGAGVLQGGAVAAMLDYAMILPVMAQSPTGAIPATTNLDVAFFRAALPGDYLARARVKRRTRAIMFLQASLFASDGQEVAAATSTVFIKDAGTGGTTPPA